MMINNNNCDSWHRVWGQGRQGGCDRIHVEELEADDPGAESPEDQLALVGDAGRGGELLGQHSGQGDSLNKGQKRCGQLGSVQKPGVPGLRGLEVLGEEGGRRPSTVAP